MPTITVHVKDLEALLGFALPKDEQELEDRFRVAKAELDGYDPETGEARVELADTNRPDLWCAEGLARQLRSHHEGKVPEYPFFERTLEAEQTVEVDPKLEAVRPFVAAFRAKGPAVTDPFLVQIIQTQEKLCENYGRRRKGVAIGIYNADRIAFPVRYVASGGSDFAFTPLGFEEVMPLDRVLEDHPKGKEYGHLVKGLPAFPLLVDSADRVLSFPPIVNSRETGEVKVGDTHLFVEATGSDMRQLVLCMNIMAASFHDRGWTVEPVMTRLPYDSTLGREVTAPAPLATTMTLKTSEFARILGQTFTPDEVKAGLSAYGVRAEIEGDTISARCPEWRDDYLHPMDVVEDFAIGRGYNSFDPVMPSEFTVGKLKPLTLLVDRVRDQMVGLGFEEIWSNILTNRTAEREHLLIPEEPLVEVANVMTDTYSVLRSSCLPSLLRVEAQSGKSLYPHRLFEAGEVCVRDDDEASGCRTEQRLTALWAAADSGFSEIHAVLDVLFHYLVKDYALRPVALPYYFEGRAGEIRVSDQAVGHIGEVHPEALTRYGITMPCAAFEVVLDRI